MPSENTRRIAKNTAMLYIRMLLIMAVSLYTSRVVLNVLGVEDFGIYNVVGGIVVMFSFLNAAMSVATQRFLSYELGRGDYGEFKKVFSCSILIHVIIAAVIFFVAETVGLWFLNTQLTISPDRMNAANWVYQFSIFAFVVNVISVPYNAAIISHEKMDVYAYVSIAEVFLKLVIVYLLTLFEFDKLKLYAILVFLVSLIIRIIYQVYCKCKFKECRFYFIWDRILLKKLIAFSGWSLFGGMAYMAKSQGVNFLLNIFFGVALNAAWGIAQQVNTAVLSFIQNFTTALNPPIVKCYANSDRSRLLSYLFNGMKYTFFLAFCFVVPLLFETEYILSLWLKVVPEYTVILVKYMLLVILIELFSHVIGIVIQATGRIMWYQVVVGGILFLNLPFSYLMIKATYSPVSVMYVSVFLSVLSMIVRFWILFKLIHFPLDRLFGLFRLMLLLCIIVFPVTFLLQILSVGLGRLVLTLFSVCTLSLFVLIVWGMSGEDRSKLWEYVTHRIHFKKI